MRIASAASLAARFKMLLGRSCEALIRRAMPAISSTGAMPAWENPASLFVRGAASSATDDTTTGYCDGVLQALQKPDVGAARAFGRGELTDRVASERAMAEGVAC